MSIPTTLAIDLDNDITKSVCCSLLEHWYDVGH